MTFKPHPNLPIRINGVRNQVAPFATRMGVLKIGGMGTVAALGEASILLTAEAGVDHDGKFIDVELAIPISLLDQVIELMRSRAASATDLPNETPSTN